MNLCRNYINLYIIVLYKVKKNFCDIFNKLKKKKPNAIEKFKNKSYNK